jgi:hypothetical protein
MRSTSKTHAARAPRFWRRTRHLLQAFADAGQPSATGLRLFVGPNGVLAWTEPTQLDEPEPSAVTILALPETSAVPVDPQSTITTPLVEPTGSSVDTPLETPAYR